MAFRDPLTFCRFRQTAEQYNGHQHAPNPIIIRVQLMLMSWMATAADHPLSGQAHFGPWCECVCVRARNGVVQDVSFILRTGLEN